MFNLTLNAPRTPAQSRAQKFFYVAVVGAALSIIGTYLDFATVEAVGRSETMQGNDKGGVGGWPVVLAVLALLLLFVATRTATLPTRLFEAAAAGLGLWIVIYTWMRMSDVKDQFSTLERRIGANVDVSSEFGFWALLLGGVILIGVACAMAVAEFQGTRSSFGYPGAPYAGSPPMAPPAMPPYPPQQQYPSAPPPYPPQQQYPPAPPPYPPPQPYPPQPYYPQQQYPPAPPQYPPGQGAPPPPAPTYGRRA